MHIYSNFFSNRTFFLKNKHEFVEFIRDPHSKKIQELKDCYQELDRLTEVAIQIQDKAAYESLQKEMREVFFDYLTAVAVDSIYKLSPHIIFVYLLSLRFPTVSIPIINWEVNVFLLYLTLYILAHVRTPIVRAKKAVFKRLSTLISQSQ